MLRQAILSQPLSATKHLITTMDNEILRFDQNDGQPIWWLWKMPYASASLNFGWPPCRGCIARSARYKVGRLSTAARSAVGMETCPTVRLTRHLKSIPFAAAFDLFGQRCYNTSHNCCGVEQRQLVGLITRRSQVRILPPLSSWRRSSVAEQGTHKPLVGSSSLPAAIPKARPKRAFFVAPNASNDALRCFTNSGCSPLAPISGILLPIHTYDTYSANQMYRKATSAENRGQLQNMCRL